MRKKFLLLFLLIFINCVFASPQEKILLVEDAHSEYGISNSGIEEYYTNSLDSLGINYSIYTVEDSEDNGPSYDTMKNYDVVIWFTGNDYSNTLTSSDQGNLSKYLDNRGKLFITGQDIGYDLVGVGNGKDFYENYLHAYFCKDDIDDYDLTGKSSDPIGNNLLIDISGSGGANNQERPSLIFYATFTSTVLGTSIISPHPENNSFYYGLASDTISKSGGKCYCGSTKICDQSCNSILCNYPEGDYCVVCGYRVWHSSTRFKLPGAIKADTGGPDGYKVVYFAYGFEGINTSEDRIKVMNRTINYLSGPKTENTKVYVRNLDNQSWEDLNITCDPSDVYCLRKMNPKINATCINNQLFGNITGAEFFVNSTGEENGTNMSATDGFNSSIEIVNGSINVSSLDGGTYFVNVHCRDSDNYWGKFDNYSFEVDTHQPLFDSPAITIKNDEGGKYINTNKPKIEIKTLSEYEPDYMSFSCNNQNWTSWIPYQQTYSNFNITDTNYGCNSTDGNRTVYVRIRDKAGNLGGKSVGNIDYPSDWVVLDRNSPTINLISPSPNAWLNTTNITFVFNFTDELSSEANCSIYINGILNKTNSTTLNNTSTSFSVFGLSEGQHNWNITCVDLAGNINSSERDFSVDITPPSITIESPEENETYSGIVNLLTTISDSGIGVNKSWYKIVNSSNLTQVFDNGTLNSSNEWDATWNSSEATNLTGNFTFIVYANDSLERAASKNISFKVDNTKPSAAIIFPDEIYLNHNLNLSLKAERPNGNITNASYWIYNSSGGIVADNTTQPNSSDFSFADFINISGWQDGNYTIIFNVTDNLNQNESDVSWFYIDREPPNLTNWLINLTNDITYHEKRAYENEEIKFSVNVSEEIKEVDKVFATLVYPNGSLQNFTLNPEHNNYTQDIWFFILYPNQIGIYNITKIFANDSLGNLNETEINISFKVVEPSVELNFGENNKIDAGQNSTFNLAFCFNKTVSNQNLTLYIPDYYYNLTNWNCTNCTIVGINNTLINLTTEENITTTKLTTNLLAGTPEQDLNSTWNLEFSGENYSKTTKIKTPLLNLSVFCNQNETCEINQSQIFNLSIFVENINNANHTGEAREVELNFSCNVFANSTFLGNINSGSNKTENWSEIFNNSESYTCIFNLTEETKKYERGITKVITVRDTEKPQFLGRSWSIDNFISNTTTSINKTFNRNQTINYFIKAKDNVEISKVVARIYNGSYTNESLSLENRYTGKYDIWKFVNKTEKLGTYNITKIYLNDTSGNLREINLTDFFEIIKLNLSSSLSNQTIEINKTQIFSANITGNATAISAVEAKISKPDNSSESLNFNFENETNNIYFYKGNYSGITLSGNYFVNITTVLESGINKTENLNFSVPYGNISIKAEDRVLVVNTTYDLPVFILPVKGDLQNVSVNINIANESIVNSTEKSQFIGNISWKDYYSGKIIYFTINSTEVNNTTINITATSLSSNSSKIINITVIQNDTTPPNINNFTYYNITNLNEINEFLINTTENETEIKNVSVEITWPGNLTKNFSANFSSNKLYELPFNGTNETGIYKFKIYSCNLLGNCINSSQGSFNVTNNYNIFAIISDPNKGQDVYFNITVRNARNQTVNDFNLTLVIFDTNNNETVVNNTETSFYSFTPDYDQPPDPPDVVTKWGSGWGAGCSINENYKTYTSYIEVMKDNNKGVIAPQFNVTSCLPTEIVSPGNYYPKNTKINLSVSVTDFEGKDLGNAISVIGYCEDCNKHYTKLRYDPETKTYKSDDLISPNEESFTLSVYSFYFYGGNKGFRGLPILTNLRSSPTGPSGGNGGTGGAGAPPGPNCTCTEWEDKGCGLSNCSISQMFQTRVCKPSGCSVEKQCIYNPICKPEKDFRISIYPETLEIEQGETKKGSIKLENTGETKLYLTILAEKECCDLNYTETLELEKKETKTLPISVHAKLSQETGEYLLKFKVKSESIEKEENLKVVVRESKSNSYLNSIKKKLPELKEEIKSYKEAGINVADLERKTQEIETLIKESDLSIKTDNLNNLKKQVGEIKLKVGYIENKLLTLKIKRFLLENKWNLILLVILILIFSYLITQVIYPYFKLSREIRILEEKNQELVNSRKETEKKYFLRKIDEKIFKDILVKTQQKIFEVRGEIIRKKETKASLLKEKLVPITLLIWIISLPVSFFRYLKGLVIKLKDKIGNIKLKDKIRNIKRKKPKIKQIVSNPKFVNREVTINGEISFIQKISEQEFLYKIRDETGEIYIFSNKELKESTNTITGIVNKSTIGQMYLEIKA